MRLAADKTRLYFSSAAKALSSFLKHAGYKKAGYCKPLITQQMGASGSPAG